MCRRRATWRVGPRLVHCPDERHDAGARRRSLAAPPCMQAPRWRHRFGLRTVAMKAAATKADVVSSEDEPLILVNSADEAVGSLAKSACHDGAGVLHRAFSLFVLNPAGETLLQRRHADKRLWPGFWSNSCCSHPRQGEDMVAAVRRRAWDELGLAVKPEFLFKFEYRASFADVGSEFELCSVFLGRSSGQPRVNTTEIAEWRWLQPTDLEREIERRPQRFTPWLKLEWQRLRHDFADRLAIRA